MGWFSRNNWNLKSKKSQAQAQAQAQQQQQAQFQPLGQAQAPPPHPPAQAPKPSFTDPPNVFVPRPPVSNANGPNRLQRPQSQQQSRPPQRPPPASVSRPNLNLPYGNQYAAHSQPQLQPAGFLPPPQGWNPGPAPAYHQQPVIVNQHYYLGTPQQQQQQQHQHQHHVGPPPPPMQQQQQHQQHLQAPHHQQNQMSPGPCQPNQHPQPPSPSFPPGPPPPPQLQPHPIYQSQHITTMGRLTGSMINLTKEFIPLPPQLYDDGLSAWHGASNMANSTYDQIYNRFNNVMTLIDHEKCNGNENDLFDCHATGPPADSVPVRKHVSFDLPSQDRGVVFPQPKPSSGKKNRIKHKKSQTACNVAVSVVSGNYFSKVELYANSKLPRELPPLALYVTTWPLLCLAAQYSQRVYEKPTGAELDAHVSGDWLTGTKAMCIKSVPMDHMNAIVFAIRGTASFMDWAVNLHDAPVSPRGFLDDPGNSCHSGFLSVAKKMIKPVAARLRQMLREDPSRSRYSLLITGHSAGGAVAALLYAHMLAETEEAESELNVLTGCFKRIHCVTFGTPPVSLLPLTKPDRPELRKSLFLSFVNEGDPVVRADKAYIRSLLELLASPPPVAVYKTKDQRGGGGGGRSKNKNKSRSRSSSAVRKPTWKVPPCTLSNAGRLIILRSGDPKAKVKERKTVKERLNEGVMAVTCAEEQLRGVIWGDPVCHLMSLYAGRVEVLAVSAVTAKR